MNYKYALYLALYGFSFRPGIDTPSELSQNTENHFLWQFVKGTKFIIPFIINEHSKLFFLSFPSVTNSMILYTVDFIYIYIYIYIHTHIHTYSQSYVFYSSHVQMWSWTIKKAECWGIVVFELLEKTLESSLDSKEIKSVNSKGNQPWLFIERTDTEAEAPILWPPDAKSWLIGKDSDAEKDWRQKEKREAEDEMIR